MDNRFHISMDELEHRVNLQKKFHDAPVQQAVRILEDALDKVMSELGVDVTQPAKVIHAQQEELGVFVCIETREQFASLNGWFISATKNKEILPWAWVGSAFLDHERKCWCVIYWVQEDRYEMFGGYSLGGKV